MEKVKDLIIKTKENGVYRYDNAIVDISDKGYLFVYLDDNYRVCFSLVNVINFSFCPEV